jgi:adenylate cyclase
MLLGLTGLLVADATPDGPLANLRNWVFDAYERNWPTPRPPNQILVIDIDSDSISHIGQWPWPRDELARLVEIAAAARVIGIDLLLTEPDRLATSDHNTDAILAASLHQVPVVLAAAADPAGAFPELPTAAATPVVEAGNDPRANLPHYRSVAWPQAILAKAAAGIGLVTVPPEADGIMRRMPTMALVGSLLIPSFAVEVVRVAAGADYIRLRVEHEGGTTAELTRPLAAVNAGSEATPAMSLQHTAQTSTRSLPALLPPHREHR